MLVTAPSHTKDAFDPKEFPHIVTWAQALITRLKPQAIVACGHSGLGLGGALMYVTGVPLFAVRKPGETTVAKTVNVVSAVAAEGGLKRWVWVDDLIDSGSTLIHSAKACYAAGLIASPFPKAALLYRAGVSSRYAFGKLWAWQQDAWREAFPAITFDKQSFMRYSR